MARKKKDLSDLKREYTKLAKRADQRLVRLENAPGEKGLSNILKFGYQKAMKMIERWSGSGAKRFNQNMPTTEKRLRAKIADMERFLKYKSSTRAGIKKVYKQVANTTNELYNTKLTWDKLEDLYESEIWKKLVETYGSDTAIRMIGQVDQNKDYFKQALKNHEQIDFQVEDDKVQEAIEESLDKYGLDLVNLY